MRIRRPSRETINEARRLGSQMAAMEPALRPDTQGSEQYLSYAQFVQAHRHFIEVSHPFEKWDYLLEQLAEHEEKSQHTWVNEPAEWDSFLREVVEPIRTAFWHSWEMSVALQKRFEERVGKKRSAPRALKEELEIRSGSSGLVDLTASLDLEARPADLHVG